MLLTMLHIDRKAIMQPQLQKGKKNSRKTGSQRRDKTEVDANIMCHNYMLLCTVDSKQKMHHKVVDKAQASSMLPTLLDDQER